MSLTEVQDRVKVAYEAVKDVFPIAGYASVLACRRQLPEIDSPRMLAEYQRLAAEAEALAEMVAASRRATRRRGPEASSSSTRAAQSGPCRRRNTIPRPDEGSVCQRPQLIHIDPTPTERVPAQMRIQSSLSQLFGLVDG